MLAKKISLPGSAMAPQAVKWNAGSVSMGSCTLASASPVRWFCSRAACSSAAVWRAARRGRRRLRGRRGRQHRAGQLAASHPFAVSVLHAMQLSASSAAFSMTERGACSPVQISNCRTACSMNICIPRMTVLPCSRARRISSVSSGL